MRRSLTILAASALLASCGAPPIQRQASDNTNITVDKLMTVDGCTVYRFWDAGATRYLTTCPGSVQADVPCGKGCVRHDSIDTVEPPRAGASQ